MRQHSVQIWSTHACKNASWFCLTNQVRNFWSADGRSSHSRDAFRRSPALSSHSNRRVGCGLEDLFCTCHWRHSPMRSVILKMEPLAGSERETKKSETKLSRPHFPGTRQIQDRFRRAKTFQPAKSLQLQTTHHKQKNDRKEACLGKAASFNSHRKKQVV